LLFCCQETKIENNFEIKYPHADARLLKARENESEARLRENASLTAFSLSI